MKPKIKINKKKVDPKILKEYPKNYNKHPESQIHELKKSLKRFGQFKQIIVWNDFVIAGNGVRKAAIEQGMDQVEINDLSHLSKTEAEALLLADNITAYQSELDKDLLNDLIDSLDLDVPGLTDGFLEDFMIVKDIKEQMEEKEINIKPFKKIHVLLSFHPDLFIKVQSILNKLIEIPGVEYEQGAN